MSQVVQFISQPPLSSTFLESFHPDSLIPSSSNNDNGIKSTAEMGSGCEVSGDVGTGTIVGHGTTHGAAEEQSPNAWDC